MNKELQAKFNCLQQEMDRAVCPPLGWEEAVEFYEEIVAHCDAAIEAMREENK